MVGHMPDHYERIACGRACQARAGPEMAIRLTKAFGSTEEIWLRM